MRRYLLARALERLPEDRRERYAQEWEADLAQLGRLRAILWALGLRRAATRLARTFGHEPKRLLGLRALPQIALDVAALAAAYVLAYRLRFGADMPAVYSDLLWQTVPFAAVGGFAILASFGLYRHASPVRVCQAVLVATLALETYATVVQPKLVLRPTGLAPLLPPAGVLLLFALLAAPALLATRAIAVRASARA
jgi:hypothetical protein